MRMDRSRLKDTQVHLLLSSRAEMQKVIENAQKATMSFMNFSAPPSQPATIIPAAVPQPPSVVPSPIGQQQQQQKPQPPVITSNSLSGILAKQMYQQHQLQLLSQQQNMPLLTSTSVRHDNSFNALPNSAAARQFNQPQIHPQASNQMPAFGYSHQHGMNAPAIKDVREKDGESKDIRSSTDESIKLRGSRSRSKSRERRDRRRSRSRSKSRDRGRRPRDRSRDRRRKRRNRSRDRSRDKTSRDRDRSRDRRANRDKGRSVENDDRQRNTNSGNNQINVWDKPPNPLDELKPPIIPFQSPFNQLPGQVDQKQNMFSNVFSSQQTMFKSVPPASQMMGMNTMGNSNNMGGMSSLFLNDVNMADSRCCIRVENIDRSCHYSAIRKFFGGLHIPNDGIKMLNDQMGNRRGEAVVRFARPDYTVVAVQKDNTTFNGSNVTVKPITDIEYNNEVDSYRPPRRTYNNAGNNDFNKRSIDNRDNRDNRDSDRSYNRNNDRFNRRDRNERDDRSKHERRRPSRFNRSSDEDDNDNYDNQNETSEKKCSDSQDEDDDVMIISDSNDQESFTALMIEDLPPLTNEQDIIKIFSDFPLVHIQLTKVHKNFHAFVKFHNKEDAEAALQTKSNHRIGYKVVYVSKCSNEAYEKAMKEFNFEPTEEDVNKIDDTNKATASKDGENQSTDTTEKQHGENTGDVAKKESESESVQVPNNNFVAPNNNSNIPSLIELNFNNFDINSAMSSSVGSGYQNTNSSDPRMRRQQTNSQPSKNNPFARQNDPRIANKENDDDDDDMPDESNFIFVGNMEYKTNKKDVLDWFSEVGLVPINVHFIKDNRGRPAGECYCEFSNAAEATRALSKNRYKLKSRVIRIHIADPEHVQNFLGEQDDDDNDEDESIESGSKNDVSKKSDDNQSNSKNDDDMDDQNSDDDNADNSDKDNSSRNEDNFNSNFNMGNMDMIGPNNRNIGGNIFHRNDLGGRGGPFGMNDNNGGNFNSRRNGQGRLNNMKNNRGMGMGNMGRGRGGGGYGSNQNFGNMDNCPSMNNINNNMGGNGGRNTMGCVISLRNVPFAANAIDILDFFSGFQLTPDDVIRRFRDDGSPTGDARVCFQSPMEARQAVEQYHNARMMNRNILLCIL